MTLKNYNDFEDRMFKIEYNRLISMGYTGEDAEELAREGIDRGMHKLLLFLILKEVKKK